MFKKQKQYVKHGVVDVAFPSEWHLGVRAEHRFKDKKSKPVVTVTHPSPPLLCN